MTRTLKDIPKERIAQVLPTMSDDDIRALMFDWDGIWARDKQQLPPGDWFTWLIRTGRGWGKTRVGAETIRKWKDHNPIIHLVARTAADIRDTMVEGESGILAISPPWDKPTYEPSKRRLTWKNGSKAVLFSADEPDQLRGPQCHKAWADELASWRKPETWDMLVLGTRLGTHPQIVVTTTPRPTKIIRMLAEEVDTIQTAGSTYENKANIADKFIQKIKEKYEGTRLGSQEIHGNILEDVQGALWTYRLIEEGRIKRAPELKRIVVAIDPAVTSEKDADDTGMVVAGMDYEGNGYVLDDQTGTYTPTEWAQLAINLFNKWKADRIIGEANNGGDLIETVIRNLDRNIPYSKVWAARGKVARAEPIAALYEQGRVHHVGILPELETEMTTWAGMTGEKSPNRIDALVWALSELVLTNEIAIA